MNKYKHKRDVLENSSLDKNLKIFIDIIILQLQLIQSKKKIVKILLLFTQ